MKLIAPDLDEYWDANLRTFAIVVWKQGRLIAYSKTPLMTMELEVERIADARRKGVAGGLASGEARRAA